MTTKDEGLLVQIASYNTNLQGNAGLPQDLVDWLSPTLQVSGFLSREKKTPDVVAVGFQELLPLNLGLAGISKAVISSRDKLIRSELEKFSPTKENYSLVAKIVNVGIALLVYARDEEVGPRIRDVQTSWTGCGPAWMGNKGAVGVRFRLAGQGDEDIGETFTFVNAHLSAHSGYLQRRISDYNHIVRTLLFPPAPSSGSKGYTTLYNTSHLFFLGDLNFRLNIPPAHEFASKSRRPALVEALKDEVQREALKEFDELYVERSKGNVFVGFREGEFWKFKCTYKYKLREVDRYNESRLPAWTDRVLYTTYADTPDEPEKSHIQNVLYTSIPSYTTSDHKPIVAVLVVPTSTNSAPSTLRTSPPTVQLPSSFTPSPDRLWVLKRYIGRSFDRIIGLLWTILWLIGLGNAVAGMASFVFGILAWRWMSARNQSVPRPDGEA